MSGLQVKLSIELTPAVAALKAIQALAAGTDGQGLGLAGRLHAIAELTAQALALVKSEMTEAGK